MPSEEGKDSSTSSKDTPESPQKGAGQKVELTPHPENPGIKTGTIETKIYVASDGIVFTDPDVALEYEDSRRDARSRE